MPSTDLYLFYTRDTEFARFVDLLEQHHIDTVVDGGVDGTGDFSPATLDFLCAANGFGYLPRGDRLNPTHAGREAFASSAGFIAKLADSGRVVVINPHSALPDVLESLDLRLVEMRRDGSVAPYQGHLDLGDSNLS